MIIFCLGLSLAGFSQSKNADLSKKAERLTKLYSLNPSQSALCLDLLKDKSKSLTDLVANKTSMEAFQEKRLEIEKTYNTNFESILNEDQKKIFVEHQRLSAQPRAVKEAVKYSTSDKYKKTKSKTRTGQQ